MPLVIPSFKWNFSKNTMKMEKVRVAGRLFSRNLKIKSI